MARKAGQIISRGATTWLVRVSLGRDPQTRTRKYFNLTIHGELRKAQRFHIETSAKRQRVGLVRCGHEPQPAARPVALNGSQRAR